MPKRVSFGKLCFNSQKEAKIALLARFNEMKEKYALHVYRKPHVLIKKHFPEYDFLHSVFNNHPGYFEILGNREIDAFQFGINTLCRSSFHIEITRDDGTTSPISWLVCISGRERNEKNFVLQGMRAAIMEQIRVFRALHKTCVMCSEGSRIEIDHHGHKEFKHLAKDFLANYSEDEIKKNTIQRKRL